MLLLIVLYSIKGSNLSNLWPSLRNAPVLAAPGFVQLLQLAVDDSDLGTGVVLLQDDIHRVEHPLCSL